MKRRQFGTIAGSTLLGLTGINQGGSESVAALEFKMSDLPKVDPSKIDTLSIDFSQFSITPEYVDGNSSAEIEITITAEGRSETKSTEVDFKNGEKITKQDMGNTFPIAINNIDTNSSVLDGQLTIRVKHMSITETYTQSFRINGYSAIKATGGDESYRLVDQGDKVVTEQELGSDESLTDYDGRLYEVRVFNQVGTQDFTVDKIGDSSEIEVLIVGGGGGGGEGPGAAAAGAGGGAGGLINRKLNVSEKTYSLTVGSGGLGGLHEDSPTSDGRGLNGDDSVAFGLTALGGGGGGGTGSRSEGKNGGSGGGGGGQSGVAGVEQQTSSASGGKGSDGGNGNPDKLGGNGDDVGGGGGGAGEKGQNASNKGPAGDGGDGLDYSGKFGDVVGENGYFAGGGGGAVPNYYNSNNGGQGGLGGGGRGAESGNGEDGQSNTGGGGGGGEGQRAGDGGSGIVLIRYPLEPR